MQVDELKALIKDLHRNGIEVFLDVVFNHTAEGNEQGPYISFKGIDNKTYYMLTPEGYYFNFSGTGNTLNCNNPIVRNMVLDCLRYWASEYHIDGFRFDLASILGRDPFGAPLSNPPLLESLAFDPILAKCRLIAEAWDAGGLYQVGSFPAYGRWAEWNGKYRDGIRKFLKGEAGMVGDMAQRLAGSPDMYSTRGPRLRSTSSPRTMASRCTTWCRITANTTKPTAKIIATAATTTRAGIAAGKAHRRSRHQRPAPAPDQERARYAPGQPGRADDPAGRRGCADAVWQQQRL